MRFGVIGCGTVAGYGHIPALAKSTQIDLVALSDVRQSRLDELGKQYNGVALYTNYQDLLARPDIDAVVVATPVGSHYPVVMAALAAEKHVLCEKPIADTVARGWEMVQAARQANRILAIDFELRAGQVFQRIKQLITAGEIGRVRFIRLVYNWYGPRWAGMDRHRLLMTEGKGPIFDCGVHYFDLGRWFGGGEYADIRADGIFVEEYPYPDHVVALCRLDNGCMVVVDESWVFGLAVPGKPYYLNRIDIEGESGTITLDHSTDLLQLTWQSAKGIMHEESAEGKAFDTTYELFVRSVQEGQLVGLASGEDGVRAIEAAGAALAGVEIYTKRKLG